jgi:regulator of replication initiation timing
MSEVSEDIFFQVKKEILDKLDIVLQKINLEIINYIKPHEDEFNFIELSFFEQEITHLFDYLDRLYASLNSSVSFSSIQTIKDSADHYHAENQRLASENQKLKKMIEHFSESEVSKASTPRLPSEQDFFAHMRDTCASMLDPVNL